MLLKELTRDREYIQWRVLDDSGNPTGDVNLDELCIAVNALGIEIECVDVHIATWGEELLVSMDIRQ